MNNRTKKILYSVLMLIVCIVAVRYMYGSGSGAAADFTTREAAEITAEAGEESSAEEEEAAAETGQMQLATLAPESGQLHFKNRERLLEHFEKHNEDFGYASAEEYEAGADAVIRNPDALMKLEKEDGDYVYFLESTGEFVVVSPQKVIRTYYRADRDYFDRQ